MLTLCLLLAAATGDPFVPFAEIPRDELLDVTKPVAIARDGSLTVGGKPRYFVATMWYGGIEFGYRNAQKNPGDIPPALTWLYADYPNYETAQRMGIDAAGTVAPLAWMKRCYRPTMRDEPKDWAARASWEKCGLSMYIDYTASEWSHGSMWYASDRPLDPDYVKPRPGSSEAKAEAKLVAAKKAARKRQDAKNKKGPSLEDDTDDELDDPEAVAANAKADQALLDAPDPGHLPPEAWTVGHNHWMPYSIVHPKGREIWFHMWEGGAKDLLEHGVTPWCCELLNEPACWDESAYAKAEFAARMKARFGADWERKLSGTARLVEYTKYIEERFASLLSEGSVRVRRAAPNALTTFQPCTIRTRGIDLYRAFRDLQVVCSPTGGRGIMEAHMLRALADGKPIVDNEMYVGNTTNSIRAAYLDQYQRGFNISYSFKWEGNKSGYNFMNRNNVRPEALLGIRLAKRDILEVNEFFTPRDRGTKREVAVLFSSPTERLAQCAGHSGYRFFDAAISAAEFAHLNPDVLFEEDVAKSLARYRVLVLSGTDAFYAGTLTAIRRWVEQGGVALVLSDNAPLTEYGEANPEDWKCPREGERRMGKGTVISAKPLMSPADRAALLVKAAARAGVRPMCETLDEKGAPAANVEVHDAVRDGLRAWSVCARTMGVKLVRFRPAGARCERLVRVWNEVTAPGKMESRRQELQPDEDGFYALVLEPGRTDFYVGGPAKAVGARYREGTWLKPISAAAAIEAGKARLRVEEEKRQAEHPAFDVDPDKVHPLDLRQFVNRRFVDKVAGDGRDGWTDQGVQQSLLDTPWGVVKCNGVPMEFIRYDQNGYRDCLVMASQHLKASPPDEKPYPKEVRGIRVERAVGSLYFLHALAWGILVRSETAWTYVVNYEDGTHVELPVRNFKEAWDWGFVALTDDMVLNGCVKGWTNGANKGLYLWKWENPHPEKRVATIDVISANGPQIPLIAAISAEEPGPRRVCLDITQFTARGGSAGVRSSWSNNVWKVALDDRAGSWVTAGLNFNGGAIAIGQRPWRFAMEANRLPDAWGNYHDHATAQFRFNGRDAKGGFVCSNWIVPKYPRGGGQFYRTDNDPDSWQSCVFYVADGIIPPGMVKVESLSIQFQQMPQEHSGLAFRNFAFEYER